MSRAAIRYAKAVLNLATEKGNADTVLADMNDVVATVSNSKELRLFLSSPIIKSADKREGLKKVFSSFSEISNGLVDVLVANKRSSEFSAVASAYIALHNAQNGVQKAVVTTAVEISDAIKAQVVAKATALTGAKHIEIENIIDPSILGGFVLRIGDMQYNASIASQLGKLKREFSNRL